MTPLVASGCADATAQAAPRADVPVVLATITIIADMAQVVGGPDVRVESITGPGVEIHGYEPSPDDLRRASEADLLLANGLGLEAWLEALVAPLDLPTVDLTDGIDALEVHGGHPAHDGSAPLNPHAWMSPVEGQRYVSAIAAALTALDPGHADGYARRAAAYSAEIGGVGAAMEKHLATLPADRRVLVTCEGAFSYLARDVGLEEAFLWPVNAERQGTPRQVGAVVRRVERSAVPAVFCESTVSATAQRQVAREAGARFGGTLYVDSLSQPDGPVPTYLDLLRYDAEIIVSGLTGSAL
ncbi:MAG TPA: zinc ABC transporter substrate-binding protein [Actinotalea sp.]